MNYRCNYTKRLQKTRLNNADLVLDFNSETIVFFILPYMPYK